MALKIRPFRAEERLDWEPLWQAYQQFYRVEVASEITDRTWSRLIDAREPMHGVGAYECLHATDTLVGIAHYVFHRSTWMLNDTCYLQDLFVSPSARGRGIGRRLIEAIYAAADASGAGQVYWLTHQDNVVARRLYQSLAKHSGFILFERFAEVPEPEVHSA